MQHKIGLALGGGGARGAIHIGILKTFLAHNIRFSAVSGTSAGSIVASCYSVGRLSALEDYMPSMDRKEILRLMDPVFSKGLFRGAVVEEKIKELTLGKRIEDAEIPLCLIAVDIKSQKEAAFKKGPIATLSHASSAVPGIFAPVEYDSMLLADGGILNNVPYDVLPGMGCDFTIAVDLNPNAANTAERKIGHSTVERKNTIESQISRLREFQKEVEEKSLEAIRAEFCRITKKCITNPELKTFFAEKSNLSNSKAASSKSFRSILLKTAESYYSSINLKPGQMPDLMLRPEREDLNSFNFLNAKKGIEYGEKYAERYIPLVDRMLENY